VWSDAIPTDRAAYPWRIERLTLYEPLPRDGEVTVEARLLDAGEGGTPRILLQGRKDDRVIVEMELLEVLLPKGPIGLAPAADRVSFLRDRAAVPGLGLSRHEDGATTATVSDIQRSDWLPGTVAALYGSAAADDVAIGDHVAHLGAVHPSTVRHEGDTARSTALPLTRFPIHVESGDASATVRPAGPPALDLSPVRSFWDDWFAIGRWPVEDVYYALIERFVRAVRLEAPDAHAAIRGRSTLFLANHQVGVESLWFSVVASALSGVPTVTLAKIEHKATWLGRLIAHNFAYPGVRDPQVITFFDRADKFSLPAIIADLGAEMRAGGRSVMVHVEGTRSLSCRVPVLKMSGAFIDMALATGAPIVPVRFVGGLPAEPLAARIEFPVGYGRQDVILGAPLLPEELGALPLKERKQRVLDSVNSLRPTNDVEEPFAGDPLPYGPAGLTGRLSPAPPALAARVARRMESSGIDEPHAVLLEVLLDRPDPHPAIARLLDAASRGEPLVLGASDEDRWLGELARRLGVATR
jgi:1-acyl-sn-glycerol-3-phosphate acyltransferase